MYVPPKGYITIYVKQDVYEQLMLLKARLRKRSVNDVIEELIKSFTAGNVGKVSSVNTAESAVTTVGRVSSVSDVLGKVSTVDTVSNVSNADPSYRLIDRFEGGGIVVEVYDTE
jgi:predicted CopG family antitoxin